MTHPRQIKIGTFIHGLGLGHWRDSDVPSDASVNIDYFISMARQAEDAKFDFTFIADTPSATKDSQWKLISRLEPLVTLGAIAVSTSKVGLAGTVSTSFSQPYDVARQLSTLDLISHGRAGWNVVTSGTESVGRNYSADRLHPHDQRYVIATEHVQVVKGLWDSWEDDAFIRNKETGEYLNREKVHDLNHEGEYFRVAGPVNIERSSQGRPIIFVAGSSPDGKRLAAREADAVFAAQPDSFEFGQAEYREWKRLAREEGRDPDSLLVFPQLQPVVGVTKEDAEVAYQDTVKHFDTAHGYKNLSWYFNDFDFTKLPADKPLPDDILDYAKDSFWSTAEALVNLARAEDLTVAETALRSVLPPKDFVGSAEEIADKIQYYFENDVLDGIILTTKPANVKRFIDLVVPILQRRGLFRTEYETSTLRGHLGLEFPVNRHTLVPAAAS